MKMHRARSWTALVVVLALALPFFSIACAISDGSVDDDSARSIGFGCDNEDLRVHEH
ncbi:MAG: hypothetical protein U0174_14190 [Polyangiaceae bacterium]